MKILYVATLVRGFEDILEGKLEARGLPTFILPLKNLLQNGHDVDIILISDFNKKMDIKVDWIKEENIIANINNNLKVESKVEKGKNLVKTIFQEWREIDKALKLKKYDLVYCHGTAAVIGNIVANIRKVPCAYRVYGTINMYDEIKKKGKYRAAICNFTYFLIFKLRKKFMLVTDDGSRGDVVYDIWKPKRRKHQYPFYFWVNGVDIENINELEASGKIPKERYLFTAGRIDPIKRQNEIIDILYMLHKQNIKIHLYLAGHIESKSYGVALEKLVHDYDLTEYVHFMGAISREYMKKLAYYSQATVLWSDIANNGNIFYEIFSTGALIVGIDDGSLNRFSTKNENIYLAKDKKEAVYYIEKLLDMPEDKKEKMRNLAVAQAKNTLTDWNSRISKEIQLLEKYAKSDFEDMEIEDEKNIIKKN